MKISVASGVVVIEDSWFDYSSLKGSGSRISLDIDREHSRASVKKLLDEISNRIFTVQEILNESNTNTK